MSCTPEARAVLVSVAARKKTKQNKTKRVRISFSLLSPYTFFVFPRWPRPVSTSVFRRRGARLLSFLRKLRLSFLQAPLNRAGKSLCPLVGCMLASRWLASERRARSRLVSRESAAAQSSYCPSRARIISLSPPRTCGLTWPLPSMLSCRPGRYRTSNLAPLQSLQGSSARFPTGSTLYAPQPQTLRTLGRARQYGNDTGSSSSRNGSALF